MKGSLLIGMMSGTSMDAIDCALVDFSGQVPRLLDFHSPVMPVALKQRILRLCSGEAVNLQALGELDADLGELFARSALELLDRNRLHVSEIVAIGSHGQTVHHQPRRSPDDTRTPFTLQIADPNILSERTGIPVVADFRRRDMAAGGQGAPLVPAFHREIFNSAATNRIVLNVGGIANITVLRAGDPRTPAFDTGPGNVLMDHWIHAQLGEHYDENGAWAAGGRCDGALLESLLEEEFFRLPPPKSTGRELFNADWLRRRLEPHGFVSPRDIQATLLELTVVSICDAVRRSSADGELIVCGGGARNGQLMRRLQELLPEFRVAPSEAFGLHADCVEAVAFAWLAWKNLAGEAVDLRDITGARHPCILGGVYGLRQARQV